VVQQFENDRRSLTVCRRVETRASSYCRAASRRFVARNNATNSRSAAGVRRDSDYPWFVLSIYK